MTKTLTESFEITKLSRGDVEVLFDDKIAYTLTDNQMEYIAEQMASHFLSCCYWDTLKHYTDNCIAGNQLGELK